MTVCTVTLAAVPHALDLDLARGKFLKIENGDYRVTQLLRLIIF